MVANSRARALHITVIAIVVACASAVVAYPAGGLAELEAAAAAEPVSAARWVAKGRLLAQISRHAEATHDFRKAVLLQACYPCPSPVPLSSAACPRRAACPS